MQIALTPSSAAEVRLIAAFMQDLADLIEIQAAPAEAVEVAPVKETEAPVKKSKAKKPAAAAVAPTVETSSVSEAPAPEPAVEEEDPAPDFEPVPEPAVEATHDLLHNFYGQLVAAGKRDAVVAAVKSFGVNAIKDIPQEKLEEVYAAMKAVK